MVLLLTRQGTVPWSALTEYDGGRLGRIGISSSAPTAEEALEAAKQWHRDHPPRACDAYMQPSSVITVGYRNAITGGPHV